MKDETSKNYEEKAARLPKASKEQLENVKSLCESLLKPLSDCQPLGGKELQGFCEKVDAELVKRKLPKINKPKSDHWQCGA